MNWIQAINKLGKQDRKAQQWLYDNHNGWLHNLCKRYLAIQEDAEEAKMNGWLKIFSKIGTAQFEQEKALAGWMKQVMVNECLQVLRKKSSLLVLTNELPDERFEEELAIDQLSAKELYILIMALPIGYRTVFNLFVIEGYSHVQIAEMLKISEGASKSQLSKARKYLANQLNQQNKSYELGKAR